MNILVVDDNATKRMPACTANVMPDEIDSIMSAGFDGLLAKPFSQEQLIESLRAS
jgi:CheY-like chemotaxis protein